MVFGLIIILLSFFLSQYIINKLFVLGIDRIFLTRLFFYHLFLSIVYYLYAIFNPSDSDNYYRNALEFYRGPEWSDFYGTSTKFIEFVSFPFVQYLGFNYEAMMALFSFFGFLGFIFFYRIFKENVHFDQKIFGWKLMNVLFLLPNLHFWSGSLGKGSFIFLGIALFFFGLNNVGRRWMTLIIGGLITYHIRPHIMFVLLVSTIIGFIFSTKQMNWGIQLFVLIVSIGAFFLIYKDVLRIVQIPEDQLFVEGFNLSGRAKDLEYATSGVDISAYSLPEQMFIFLFRPLFFDAPGLLGIIVSFENVFLLIITLYFIFKGGILFIFRGNFLVKTAFLSFITVSIALAQIAGNLGIAIRQKSQVMLLFLFVIVQLLDEKKIKKYKRRLLVETRRKKQAQMIRSGER